MKFQACHEGTCLNIFTVPNGEMKDREFQLTFGL